MKEYIIPLLESVSNKGIEQKLAQIEQSAKIIIRILQKVVSGIEEEVGKTSGTSSLALRSYLKLLNQVADGNLRKFLGNERLNEVYIKGVNKLGAEKIQNRIVSIIRKYTQELVKNLSGLGNIIESDELDNLLNHLNQIPETFSDFYADEYMFFNKKEQFKDGGRFDNMVHHVTDQADQEKNAQSKRKREERIRKREERKRVEAARAKQAEEAYRERLRKYHGKLDEFILKEIMGIIRKKR